MKTFRFKGSIFGTSSRFFREFMADSDKINELLITHYHLVNLTSLRREIKLRF